MHQLIAHILAFSKKVTRKFWAKVIHPYYKEDTSSLISEAVGVFPASGKIIGNYTVHSSLLPFGAFFFCCCSLGALIYVKGLFLTASKPQLNQGASSNHSTVSCAWFEKYLHIHSKEGDEITSLGISVTDGPSWPSAKGPLAIALTWLVHLIAHHRAATFGIAHLWFQRKYQPSTLFCLHNCRPKL